MCAKFQNRRVNIEVIECHAPPLGFDKILNIASTILKFVTHM